MQRARRMRWGGSSPARAAAAEVLGRLIGDALRAACHPETVAGTSVGAMDVWPALIGSPLSMAVDGPLGGQLVAAPTSPIEAVGAASANLVADLFHTEGASLVRLVRLFVDDRNAAEDIVQEGFIRLSRAAHRIEQPAKAAAYLRSIVLNLARDHNRRGLVSLRHHLPFDDARASLEDEIELRDVQRQVIEALRDLPRRQRDCLVFRYYHELPVDEVAAALGISPNSVKTHLKRGLRALEVHLAAAGVDVTVAEEPA